MRQDLPPDLRALRQEEQRQALRAAANFAAVCARGDAEGLYNASLWLDESGDGWRLAMIKIARLVRVTRQIQDAFVSIWVEHKMLPLRVGDRAVLAKALRVLMRGGYGDAPLTLYRGAKSHEHSRRIYNFSWSTDIGIARKFAKHWANPDLNSNGIVLETLAPPEAVLLMRQPEDYFDEGEVVVDPFRLDRVKLIETIQSSDDAKGQPIAFQNCRIDSTKLS